MQAVINKNKLLLPTRPGVSWCAQEADELPSISHESCSHILLNANKSLRVGSWLPPATKWSSYLTRGGGGAHAEWGVLDRGDAELRNKIIILLFDASSCCNGHHAL